MLYACRNEDLHMRVFVSVCVLLVHSLRLNHSLAISNAGPKKYEAGERI